MESDYGGASGLTYRSGGRIEHATGGMLWVVVRGREGTVNL